MTKKIEKRKIKSGKRGKCVKKKKMEEKETENELNDIASTDSRHMMKVAFIMRKAVLFYAKE